jgi:preprotein translocase subunit SecF
MKFFEVISSNANFEIIGFRKKFMVVSGLAILLSLGFIFTKGLNFGIDFSGGTEIQIEFDKSVKLAKLEQGKVNKSLAKAFPGSKSEAQRFGDNPRSFLFKFGKVTLLTDKQQKALEQKVVGAFPGNKLLKNTKRKGFVINFRTEGGTKADIRFTKQLVVAQDAAQKAVKKGKKAAKKAKKPAKKGKKAAKKGKKAKKAVAKGRDDKAKIAAIFKGFGLTNIKVEGPVSRVRGFLYTVSFEGLSKKISDSLSTVYGKGKFKVMSVESVGPRVGRQLRNQGVLALLLAMVFILIYIAIRFDFRYAPGAVAALLHDVLITTGLFSILNIPFDLSIIAALLTIVGYSLNDTIVVYDRIRENWQKSKSEMGEVMNRSINETLSRTLLTSVTTFAAVLPIYFIGGSNIRWFAFAMMFGILIGTYSSLAVASPIVYLLDSYSKRKGQDEDAVQEEKRMQRRRRKAAQTS